MKKPLIQNFLCFNFYVGWREIDQIYKKHLGNEITPQVTYILQLLDENGETTVNQLSEGMKLRKSAVSNLISRMEKNKLVIRTMNLYDRRVVDVNLTDEGINLLNSIKSKIDDIDEEISKSIKDKEKEIFFNIVDKIRK